MSDTNAVTFPTLSHGKVRVWEEVQVQHGWVSIPTGIWQAEGDDVHGRTHQGYGQTPAGAIVNLLVTMGAAKQDPPAPLRPLADVGAQIRAGTNYVEQVYGQPQPTHTQYSDLPEQFWYHVRQGEKIRAIKKLREVTGMSLKSSKEIVDGLGTYGPPMYAFGFDAGKQPLGTVIKINGSPSVKTLYGGYVFERMSTDTWHTTGDEADYSDHTIDDLTKSHGYRLLYVPKEA